MLDASMIDILRNAMASQDATRSSALADAFGPSVQAQEPPPEQRGFKFDLGMLLAGLADAAGNYAATSRGGPGSNAVDMLQQLRDRRRQRASDELARQADEQTRLRRQKGAYELERLDKEKEAAMRAMEKTQSERAAERQRQIEAEARSKERAEDRAFQTDQAALNRRAEAARAKMYDDTRNEIATLRKTLADDKVGREKLAEQDKILAAARQEALDIKRLGRIAPDGKTRIPVKPDELAAAKADFLDDAEAAGLEGPHLKLAEEWWDRKVGSAAPATAAPVIGGGGHSFLRPYDNIWRELNAGRP